MENQFVEDVKAVLDDKEVLKRALEDARQAKIQGEHAQQQTIKVVNNHDAFYRLCRQELHSREGHDFESIDTVINRLTDQGHLAEREGERFLSLWEEINWVVPAVSIQEYNLKNFEPHWSQIELNPNLNNPEEFQYTLRWGVDEQLDAQVPANRLVRRSLYELTQISSYLRFWLEDDDIDDETVAHLADRYDIEWATDVIEELAEEYAMINAELSETTAYSELSLEVSWESGNGPRVGTLTITPGDEIDSDMRDGPDDEPPRGFQ